MTGPVRPATGRRSAPAAVGSGRRRPAPAGRQGWMLCREPAGRAHNISPLFRTAKEAVLGHRRSPSGMVSFSDEHSGEELMAAGVEIALGEVSVSLLLMAMWSLA